MSDIANSMHKGTKTNNIQIPNYAFFFTIDDLAKIKLFFPENKTYTEEEKLKNLHLRVGLEITVIY